MSAAQPLRGMHAIVTGAGRGIGFAVAHALADAGATLSLIGRDAQRLQAALDSLPDRDRCDAHACDLTDAGAVKRTFAAIVQAHPDVAVLVNNAGAARSAKFGATDEALWQSMLDVNLTAAFRCTHAALGALLAAPAGRIVNIASTAGLIGYPYVAAYCAAKHGLVGLTRALALELAGTRVTVNAVCPGYTDTDLVAEAIESIVAKTGRTAGEARAALAMRNPQKRLVTPAEVAATVAWLCMPASAAITGQAIAVAGGEVMAG